MSIGWCAAVQQQVHAESATAAVEVAGAGSSEEVTAVGEKYEEEVVKQVPALLQNFPSTVLSCYCCVVCRMMRL